MRLREGVADAGLDGPEVVREDGAALGQGRGGRRGGRQRRRDAGGRARPRPGTWPGGRWRGYERRAGGRAVAGGRGEADGGVGVDQLAGRAQRVAMVARAWPARRAMRRRRVAAHGRQAAGSGGERAGLRGSRPWRTRAARRRAPSSSKSRRSKLLADLDVHRRADGRHDRAARVVAVGHEAGEDVVAVGGDDQAGDRQAHAAGDPAGVDVAEIAGGHGEGDRAVGRAEAQRGVEVVDGLATMRAQLIELTAERRESLAEERRRRTSPSPGPGSRRTCPATAMLWTLAPCTVVICRRCTSRDAALRVQHDDVDAGAAGEGLDGRRPGVAGGGADDGDALVAAVEEAVEHAASNCMATSLNASVGPWNSSSSHTSGPSCLSGAVAGWAKPA